MAGEFADLIEANAPATNEVAGAFSDLVPEAKTASGAFDDLVPRAELREAKPESLGKKILRTARETLTPLIGPSPEQMMREAASVDGQGNPVYKPAGSAVEREGLFPAMSHPMVAIPRAPSWPKGEKVPLNLLPEVAGAAAYNVLAGFGEFMESPLGLATGGMGIAATPMRAGLGTAAKEGMPMINRIMAGGYAADIARHVPEQARQLGELSVTGTPQEIMEAGGGLAASVALPGALAHEAFRPGAKPKPEVMPGMQGLSEFGGRTEIAPPSGQGGVNQTRPGANGEAVLQGTVPETPETLISQLEWVKQGKRPAVLVTPGEAAPEVPEGMEIRPTSAGTFIYDPKQTTPAAIDAAVKENKVGELLGYGIPNKPPGADTAVVIRAADGTEKQAVVTDRDPENARKVMAAALREEFDRRQTGEKIEASTAISDPVKQAITEYLYRVRSNADDEATAAGIVEQFGLAAAEKTLRDPPIGMAQAIVSKLLGEVTRTMARQEQQARTAGEMQAAEAMATRQAQLWDELLPRITEMAQGLQALTDIVDMSPDAQVARLKLRLERQGNRELDRHGTETAQMQGALEAGRKQGVEQLQQDPEANAAARKAVDAAVADSEEVKQAIVMELAGPWSESPHIVAHARELARSRVDEMMTEERPPAEKLTPAKEYARKLLDDLARRAANIFAMHLQGADPGLPIVQKFQRELGLSEGKAREMAASLQKEWDKQLKAAREALPKRIAMARATRERNAGQSLNSPTAAVDARIRKELDALNTKLGQVLRGEAGRREQTGAHVAERIVQASGLTGEAADTFRTVLQNRWDAIVSTAQRQALEQLQRASGVRVSRPLKSAFQRLIELERLGGLTSERFYDVVKRALKLKQLTPADAAQLRKLAQRAQQMPEGYLRQQAAAEVMKLTERLSGSATWRDVPMAIFYANILSGLTTPAKIVFENMNLLASSTVAALLTRPRDLMNPVEFVGSLAKAYGRGLTKGAAQAAGTLRTGVVSGLWRNARPPTVLEMKPFGERFEPLNFWKYFIRVISTAHETTFKPGWEMKQTLIARDLARQEGLSGKALTQRVADLLANTEEHVSQARAQAMGELQATGELSKLNLARRAAEIVEQQREANMPGSTETAREFALRMAYLNEPYGFLGLLTRGLRSGLETARRQYPVFGTAAKTQIPFTTIIANILNEKLNWTPWGLARALTAERTGQLYGREALPGEKAELYAKALVGTAALSALYYLLGDQIHGNGPSDPHKRKQMQAAGWVPHSIQIGDRYVSYMNTPAGLGLAVIGNLNDWHRYGKGDEAGAASRATFALKATGNAIVSQGMLDSVRRIFEAIGSESTTEGADKLEKVMARTASSFVVPNLVQQADRIWDPTVYDQTGIEALVKSQVPFVRRDNKPVLTVLGDPVQSGPFHYWAGQVTDDALLRTIAEKQAWIPEPNRNQIVGDRKRGPDYSRAMTPDEFYEFIATSGPEIRRRLSDELDRIALMEPDQARKFVAKIAEEEHAKAKKLFE